MIGTFPGGGRLWGGPYTVPQFAVMAATFGAMMLTRTVWGVFGLFDIVLALGVPYAAGFAVRKVQVDGRNPLAVIASAAGLAAAPRGGRLEGRSVPRCRPRAVTGVCTLSAATPKPVAGLAVHAAGPAPATPPNGMLPASGVAALLAQRARRASADGEA
ncbi:hypothetical protein [Actinacidiphila rubida]|uniref:hypothetical protein n=1 Tax=Actinacidiphila rubida TaxID=310780 RepID=UPI00114D2A0E|nr:hypothetical protein [Actinacidiphila rubida]